MEPLDFALPTDFARMPSVSLASSEEELRYVNLCNALFDYFLLPNPHTAFLVIVVSSQHPTASPAHVIEITSSRTELEEQPTYPLPSVAAAATDEAGTSAAGAAPSAPPTTAVPLVDLTAPPSTPDSLLNHVSLLADVVF